MSHRKGDPIILSDFISITADFDKGILLMRKTAETDDVVAAAYKDQIAHYTKEMLETESKGERVPVIETMRMLGEQEFNVAQEIERVWDKEVAEQKEFVDKKHKVREFVAQKVQEYLQGQFDTWIGADRAQKVIEIQRGIHQGPPTPPATTAKPEEKPTKVEKLLKRIQTPPENELASLEAMKKALEEKIAELKKSQK